MLPLDLIKKVQAAVKNKLKGSGSFKTPFLNLIVLLFLGVALMVLSHLFSGGSHSKSPPLSDVTQTSTTSANSSDAAKPTALLNKKKDQPQTLDEYATYYEDRLTSILDSMAGISNAKVLVTLESGPEQVYQQDIKTTEQRTTERDSNGGTRSIVNQTSDSSLVTIDQGNGQKAPILVTQKGPTFKAILIVANGVGRPTAQERIKNAVSTVLDVPSYKVSVQERK